MPWADHAYTQHNTKRMLVSLIAQLLVEGGKKRLWFDLKWIEQECLANGDLDTLRNL